MNTKPPANSPENAQMTADEIAAYDDRPVVKVLVPEWKNRVVTAREPDAAASLVILRSATTEDENGKAVVDELDLIVKTVVEGCIDPKFSIEHIPALKQKSEVPLTRIYKAIKGKKNILTTI